MCLTDIRTLEVRDVPTPYNPPRGHVLVDMDSATITHGDKFFLTRALPGGAMSSGQYGVYGSNGAGRVVAIGPDVPPEYAGRQVAIYKTLARSADSIGLWCERAQIPYGCCLILPEHVAARDYNGSFANVLTVYAFLSEIRTAGHQGIIVMAGSSATGYIAASLAHRQNIPAIFLVRSQSDRDELARYGVQHVIGTTDADFENQLRVLADELKG